jgi:hypothetical protein
MSYFGAYRRSMLEDRDNNRTSHGSGLTLIPPADDLRNLVEERPFGKTVIRVWEAQMRAPKMAFGLSTAAPSS